MENNTAVDVTKIMSEIRQKIKNEGLTSSMLSFEEIPMDKPSSELDIDYNPYILKQSAELLCSQNQLTPNKPIEGNPLVRLMKKVIRKLTQFYVVPIVLEQNTLNFHYANAVSQLYCFTQESEKLNIKLSELERQHIMDEKRIAELESRLRELEKSGGKEV